MAVVELKNINKKFGTGDAEVHVLKDVNFQVNPGQLVAVVGPSGSGKSTFLTIAGGIQTPTSGDVIVEGNDLNKMNLKQRDHLRLNKVGFVLQSYNLIPFLKVKEQFSFVDRVKKTKNVDKKHFQEILSQLGISNLMEKYPAQLSGGQTQRVAIARALYVDPAIVLADEPTAALDSQKVMEVGAMFRDLAHNNNKAIVLVTHDERLEDFADVIYQILDGKLSLLEKKSDKKVA